MTFSDMIFHTNSLNDGLTFLQSIDLLKYSKLVHTDIDNEELKINNRVSKRKVVLNDAIWKRIRLYCLSKFKNECAKCGDKPELNDLHVDHIKPKSLFPHLKYKIYNLQLLCKKCNFDKGNKNCNDYRVNKFTDNSMKL